MEISQTKFNTNKESREYVYAFDKVYTANFINVDDYFGIY